MSIIHHKVNTNYIRQVRDGMGTWLAVFENDGDVVASISKRPNLMPIAQILDEHGDEIFRDADSIIVVNEGKITGVGPHAQLLEQGGVYADLYRTQRDIAAG